MTRTLAQVEQALGADTLHERTAAAAREAAVLDEVLERTRTGASRTAALRDLVPDRPVSTMLRRVRDYVAGGRDALISRRYPPAAELKMTPDLRGGLRALALSDAHAGAEILAERLSSMFGVSVSTSSVQQALQELGLARPRGRPWWRAAEPPVSEATVEIASLSLAGAELLKAVDEACGAVASLTAAMGARLAALPAPDGPVHDDGANRDERGRFLASYNLPKPRIEPELGSRFNSVSAHRQVKDLRQMRVAEESPETRHRKNLGLVLLPCVVRSARWSALQHWRGHLLGELIGFDYQASTLDKYLRELKLAGCADPSREAVASFWLGEEGPVADERTGAVVLYADAATKPLWTHHWSRSTKVSRTGRLMPATTTMTLHSGAGTPLLYRSFSGHASLPANALAFLEEYERHAGEGTARRMIVMDREAHAVWLFKSLDPRWGFVIPLRSAVVGPSARFEDQGEWGPYGTEGDEVCDAWLWLNDPRPGQAPLRIRVVGRHRHRSGKVAWFATNRPVDELPASDAIRLYFDRWPAQEHVYRDGTGAVGLEVHHGYGKQKVDNVAVIDRQERLTGQIGRLDTELVRLDRRRAELNDDFEQLEASIRTARPTMAQERAAFDASLATGQPGTTLRKQHANVGIWEAWLEETQSKVDDNLRQTAKVQQSVEKATSSREAKTSEVERLATKRRIFTVDVELDEVMTAYKLTFMNLCHLLMARHLGQVMEIETLIEAVLTLPGEREVTATSETVRIYRQERDPETMEAVQRACTSLTSLGLHRGDRLLRFEMAEPPARVRRVDRSGV